MNAAHLDYDVLADLAEGLLDEELSISAEAHLADCADCRIRATELADLSRVLADAPAPPMPAHLVDRLDAAIAAEVASHQGAQHGHARFRFLAAAAAALVVIGGGGVAVRGVLDTGASSRDRKSVV